MDVLIDGSLSNVVLTETNLNFPDELLHDMLTNVVTRMHV